MPLTQDEKDAADCGVLKFISVDWDEWHFQSRASPQIFHTVHLADWSLSGACSCPHFDMRIRPLLEARVVQPHHPRAKCKHILRAERILCFKMKKALFKQSNPNPPPE